MTDRGNILPFLDMTAIEVEAASWVARFDAGDISAKDQAAFQEWLNRSPIHRASLADYGKLWSDFDALGLLANVQDIDRAMVKRRPVSIMKRAAPWLAACAAALVLAQGVTSFHPEPARLATMVSRPILAKASYETAVGGQRRIALTDGSSVVLNTNSRLDVDFSGKCRDVHLVRGEAYFEVVHNKARPFTVYASNYVVRDIGTAFDIHLSKAGLVEVGVTKGSVEVASADAKVVAGTRKSLGIIAAGHNIVLGQKVEQAEIVSKADMGRKLAWRQGQLIYTGQPLSEVLADVSRYSDIKVELADPALANLSVGGAFRTDQIEAIFAALENNFGIQARWVDPQHVRFVAGPQKAPAKD